ncbi:hypothetical protein V512_013170 [Mesotoga sp. Brook.08.105.5.1]|nr:hypothetical protein V512_013170 [Mesotoga sp. Brook.08.105.5.1]
MSLQAPVAAGWIRGKRDEDRGKKIKIFALFQPLACRL